MRSNKLVSKFWNMAIWLPRFPVTKTSLSPIRMYRWNLSPRPSGNPSHAKIELTKTLSILFRKDQRITSHETDTLPLSIYRGAKIFTLWLSCFQPVLVNLSDMKSIKRGRSLVFFTILFMPCFNFQNVYSMMSTEILPPCPDSPNCVSSLADDEQHFIAPFVYTGTISEAQKNLVSILQSIPRARIISIERNYVQVEFTSVLFRFIDDAEFCFPENENRIHVRSASRVGYYDFGVNRTRLEHIRKLLRAESQP